MENLYSNGQKLEIFTNACYQTLNYYIETNLKVTEEKHDKTGNIDILEIDIFAKIFTSTLVETTLIECKRGCKFNDLLLFSGVSNVVKADNNVMVAIGKNIEDIKIQGENLGIHIIEPGQLYKTIIKEREYLFLYHYEWNEMKHSIISVEFITYQISKESKLSKLQKKAYSEVRSYLALLSGKVWRETDLVLRANSLSSLMNSHKDFVRKVAKTQNLFKRNQNTQFYIDSNPICQAAGSIVLEIKIAYIVCAVECAISKTDLDSFEDQGFRQLVTKLIKNIELAKSIPIFVQYFFNIFGGIYINDEEEIMKMSNIIGITPSEFHQIISFLKELFTIPEINIQWGFIEDFMTVCMRGTPSLYKAMGIKNRISLGFDTDKYILKNQWEKKLEEWSGYYE
jgi:hypothetical protein